MKLSTAFFIVLTAAELLFTAIYYLVRNRLDRIILAGAIIYIVSMITGYIAFRIIRYNKKKSDLLDALPD